MAAPLNNLLKMWPRQVTFVNKSLLLVNRVSKIDLVATGCTLDRYIYRSIVLTQQSSDESRVLWGSKHTVCILAYVYEKNLSQPCKYKCVEWTGRAVYINKLSRSFWKRTGKKFYLFILQMKLHIARNTK